MKKIDLGVIVTTLIIVTISCSLAFFAARVVGNPKDINLVAKNVAITFTDTSSIASDVISPGWNNVKTFTITNNSKEDFSYNITIKGLVNTFESINTLQYKITSDNGYNMDNYLSVIKTETSKDVVLAYDVVIPKGSKQTYQVEFKYVSIEEDQSSDMGKKLGGTLAIEESTGTPEIYDKLLADNPTIKTRTDFSTTLTETNVNTLYKAKENNTDVYYFAGDARNNWVKFAGYHWRIIRTNSDGSVRLLYVGTSPDTTEGYIGLTNYNESKNDSMLVGYMYGTSGSLENNRSNKNSSLIKTYIDNWYETKLINYTKYLSTEAVYCNDRNVTKDTYAVSGSNFNFDVYYRLETEFTPTYSCSDSYDAFSYSNINAKLRFPIALMTADELMYLGFVFSQASPSANNTYAWVNRNSNGDNVLNYWWWTMSPNYYNVWDKMPVMRVTYIRGVVGSSTITNPQLGAVRPVISINGNNIWKNGDGSAEHPYEIEDFTSLKDKILSDNPTIKTRTDFSTPLTETNINTLYKAQEDNTDVYYFAGEVENNWVKFAGFYWRIIRTNSDGSVRLLYVGTSSDTKKAYIGQTNYNNSDNDSMLVGYKYGTSGSLENNRTNENSSLIKTYIDNWYKDNLTDYTKYLSTTAVYCNDRTVTKDTYTISSGSFYYDAYYRLETTFTPTYTCSNSYDAFSFTNVYAKLDYPVGLITADELAYLGITAKNSGTVDSPYTWVNKNSNGDNAADIWWWTMTPNEYNEYDKQPTMRVAYRGGKIGGSSVTNTKIGAVRPVISIKENAVYKSGDGSATNPYEIVLN